MATTAVFAEILIIGLEAEALLALVLVTVFGTDWIELDALEGWTAFVALLLLAAAYVLGIVVDRLADSAGGAMRDRRLGAWLNDRFGESSRNEDWPASEAKMRMRVLAAGGSLAAFLEYQRSRLRVARGTVLTSFLAVPAVAAFFAFRADPGVGNALIVLALLVLLFLASVAVAERIHCAYVKRLADAFRLLESGDSRA